MTSTRSSTTNTKTRSATRRLESFRQRFGDGHFYLACHAALPLALTPDLLYSLWANFQRDTHGEAIEIPWIAVADLMLSNLCKEVGNELYEMDQPIRDELLNQLQNDSRFGLARLQELADFVMAYVEQQLDSPDLDVRDLAQGQQWRALTYKNPSEAAHSIATVLAQLPFDDKAEWIRMAALLNSLAEPLSAFQPLLNYIRAMADLARGNLAAATAQMTQTVNANREVWVEDVNLPIPDVLNGMLPNSNETDVLPTAPPNRLWMPIVIAGATITSILILIGVQYGLRSPTPQPPSITLAPPASSASNSAKPTPQPSTITLTVPPSKPQRRTPLESVRQDLQEFPYKLATLRGRMDALEARIISFERGHSATNKELLSISTESNDVADHVILLRSTLETQISSIKDLEALKNGSIKDVQSLKRSAEELSVELATQGVRSDALQANVLKIQKK